MGNSPAVVEALVASLAPLAVRARAMFGGHSLYCDDKVVALVCDDRVYLKPTSAAEDLDGELEQGPPYPGAKPCWILDERVLEDHPRLRELVQATADALPKPKKRASKKSRRRADP